MARYGAKDAMSTEIVWRQNDYLITRNTAIFGTGYNCYKVDPEISTEKKLVARKINPELEAFTNLSSAVIFCQGHRDAVPAAPIV